MDGKTEGVCGRHLCFTDQSHKRFVAGNGKRCKDGGNTCYDNNPGHALCTQYLTSKNAKAPSYSYEKCLEQCRDQIPGCYGFNYNVGTKTCYHLVLPDGETSRCTATAVSSEAYLTATCNDCPPNNSPRSGCGGYDVGTCSDGTYAHMCMHVYGMACFNSFRLFTPLSRS